MGHGFFEQGCDNLHHFFHLIQPRFAWREAVAEFAELLLAPSTASAKFATAVADGHRTRAVSTAIEATASQ